jgi:hypothetical protein
MAILQIEVIETATAEDFSYPEHAADWLPSGVCKVCGRIGGPVTEPVNDLGGQGEARFGADEYLTW